MKATLTLLAILALFFATPAAHAVEKPHDHALVGGPKGGRLLEHTEPRAEFFVEKDKTVTITFYDSQLNPVPVAEQTVVVIAELDGVKTTLEFEKKDDVLVSKGKLPEGHAPKLVVQFKQTADAKQQNFRFVIEDHVCSVCKRAEYACICGH